MNLMNVISKYYPIFIAIVVAVIILLFVYLRSAKKRRLTKQFDQLEISYNEMMSIPVLFKLNKSVSITKINPDVIDAVEACKKEYEDVNSMHTDIATVLADVEDAIAFGKLKDAGQFLSDLEGMVNAGLEKTKDLDQHLENLLEQETKQRHEINELKETFRLLKQKVAHGQDLFQESHLVLEEQVKYIEGLFSTFEEWMYATDFEKAKEITIEITEVIDLLSDRIETIPHLYQTTQGILPSLFDAVTSTYQQAISNQVFVDHLEVPRNLGLLSDVLKDDLRSIHRADLEGTEASLAASTKRLEQLQSEMEKETRAKSELDESIKQAYFQFSAYEEELEKLLSDRELVNKRYQLENYQSLLDKYTEDVDNFNKGKVRLDEMYLVEKLPASTVLVSVNEWNQDMNHSLVDFMKLHESVKQARSDELRAENQLLKLHLIINDVQVRIKRRALPKISETYEADIAKSYHFTDTLKKELNEETLDIAKLNQSVDDAIDYIYKLHNNVNNLVGVVDMCENAFVYANKYRAYVSDIDHELTRAELSFNAGEYTKSLKTIISAIDRYKPGSEFEELIKNNAKSAR